MTPPPLPLPPALPPLPILGALAPPGARPAAGSAPPVSWDAVRLPAAPGAAATAPAADLRAVQGTVGVL
jgi:hypothetical protein